MTIVSKDYGVLFKLLRAGRISELTKLEEEVSPGHWWNWPTGFSCRYKPKLTKEQMREEAERIYDEEEYHEFGDRYGIYMQVLEDRKRSSYWCGPVFDAPTRKDFIKECSKKKVRFTIDEDLYDLFCEPKKLARRHSSNRNLWKSSEGMAGS